MKCFTLKAKRDIIVAPSLHHPITYIAPELYPDASAGIAFSCKENEVEIAPGLKASLSPELIAECRHGNKVADCLVVERASVEQAPDGSWLLVPEKPGDDKSALVFVDLGRGGYSSVRYEIGNRVYLRGRRQSDALFGTEELALVSIPEGRPFSAFRSSRRWWCFGGEVVGEQLHLRFNGKDLSCGPCQ